MVQPDLNILISAEFSLLSSFFYGPTFRTVCHSWSHDCFEDFVFRFHGHLPIALNPGYFLPLHPPDSDPIYLCTIIILNFPDFFGSWIRHTFLQKMTVSVVYCSNVPCTEITLIFNVWFYLPHTSILPSSALALLPTLAIPCPIFVIQSFRCTAILTFILFLGKTKQQQIRWNNGGKKLLSKLVRNFVMNYVERQQVRRKQVWKAGGGMMRQRARLGRRNKDWRFRTEQEKKTIR